MTRLIQVFYYSTCYRLIEVLSYPFQVFHKLPPHRQPPVDIILRGCPLRPRYLSCLSACERVVDVQRVGVEVYNGVAHFP